MHDRPRPACARGFVWRGPALCSLCAIVMLHCCLENHAARITQLIMFVHVVHGTAWYWCSICAWGLAAVSARPAPLVCASAPVPAAGLAMRGGPPLSYIAEWALAAQCDEISHIK